MLIVGAGGFAAQLFQEIELMKLEQVVFWSETPTPLAFIKEKYEVIDSDEQVRRYFSTVSTEFVIAVGGGEIRRKLTERFIGLGGKPVVFISPITEISPHIEEIGEGTVILKDVVMEPGVKVGKGCLLNRMSNIGHGCEILDFAEIAPFAILAGNIVIGESTLIGIGSIIIPKMKIGNHVVVAAGAVVTKNIPDYAVVAGNPAKVRFFKKEKPVI